MIKRLIFDVDGTLITNVSFYPAIQETLKYFQIYNEEKEIAFIEAIDSYEKKYNNYNKEDYLKHFSVHLKTPLDEEFLNVF